MQNLTKDLVAASKLYYEKYLQNFKFKKKCKKGLYFSFDFGWYSIHLNFVRLECREWGGFA